MNLEQAIEKAGTELAPLFKEGAKVYLTEYSRMGKVFKVVEKVVRVNCGTKSEPMPILYEMPDYLRGVLNDTIVHLSRVKFGDEGEFIGVNPRSTPKLEKVSSSAMVKQAIDLTPAEDVIVTDGTVDVNTRITEDKEVGFINEKTGKFSKEKKRGYVEIRFERVRKKVELELDESQLEKLKEMGII